MKSIYTNCFLLCIFVFISAVASYAQSDVLTQHNDLSRTGWYPHESVLNTKNVKSGSFGKLFSRTVDDQIYAQPLVVRGVSIPNAGTRNIVLVATVNNTIYAFDADSANVPAPYWQISLTPAGERAPKNTDMTGACGGGYRDFSGNMGIVGTPVIDSATQTLYVVARSVTTTNKKFKQYLHALDITTGAERPSSPMLIEAQVAGNGDGSVNGIVTFNPQHENQRCGLLLVNDNVYITFSSHCDWGPYHGWLLGYNKTTLQQTRVYNSTPNGYNGGIWMSGAAPSADEAGNLYLAIGNGSIGANGNVSDPIARSESALQLTPSGTGFTLNTFFTPSNISELEAGDLDFGVTQMMLLPNTNRVITSCKDGHIYVMNRNSMGGYSATKNNVVQSIDLGVSAHLRSSLSYYKGATNEWMYSWSENALLKAFPYNRTSGKFDLNNVISSGVQGPSGNNGALLSVSSNGSNDSTAVLWASYASNGDANQSVRPGILRAFDANDVTKELWNSSQSTADNPGNYAKFNCPTIINGKVYLATFSNKLVVYGLTDSNNNSDTCNSANIALNKPAVASSIEGDGNPASAAFDGDAGNTRWASEQQTDPQWIYVDLGKRYDLCKVVLRWEVALGEDFQVQVSDDANSWTPVETITGNTDFVDEISLKATGRYVRMYGTKRGTGFGYSLYEFEVYGKESASNCAPPASLTATNIYTDNAVLSWDGNGAMSFTVQYKTVSAGSWTTLTTDSSSLNLTGLSCGTDYLFQVQAKCNNGNTSDYASPSAFSTLSCDVDCSPLPTRWTTQDIGDVGAAGSVCYDNETFTLHGSGKDIWENQDAFRFAYTTNVGDFEITARVATQDNSDVWNKCGLMIRESLTTGSRNAFIAMTSGNGAAFQSRTTTDDITSSTWSGTGTVTAPFWLKIVKKGSVYTGYGSPDGNKWRQLGTATDAGFGANAVPVYAGLAITSHNDGVISTATVDNYLLTGQVLPLRLVSFGASLSLHQTVNVLWVVASDEGIKEYVLQRSPDNRTFSDIATVAAETRGGSAEDYSYEDRSPLHGLTYYRLRVVNLDGSIAYSAVATVTFTGSQAPVLAPNPASGSAGIIPGSELIKFITIYDISGRAIYRATNTISSRIIIPVSGMSNGTYVVEMRTATTVYKEKLVVHN